MEFSQNSGELLGGTNNSDDSILGSIFGFPYLGKLQNEGVPFAGSALSEIEQLRVCSIGVPRFVETTIIWVSPECPAHLN